MFKFLIILRERAKKFIVSRSMDMKWLCLTEFICNKVVHHGSQNTLISSLKIWFSDLVNVFRLYLLMLLNELNVEDPLNVVVAAYEEKVKELCA
nr:hypothetical protein [Tanacetum cinerariifolium]